MCSLAGTARSISLLHLRDIDTKLPQDLPDELMGVEGGISPRETDMTSLICRIRVAQLAETISDTAFGSASHRL